MYKIDTDVPMPKVIGTKKYPFNEMKIGDSMFFENADHADKRYGAAKVYFRRKNMKITSRLENNGIRFWVIE